LSPLGEEYPPLYDQFGGDYEAMPVSDSLRSVLTVLHKSPTSFHSAFQEHCRMRDTLEKGDVLDLTDIR
jgi:hypothetical protein